MAGNTPGGRILPAESTVRYMKKKQHALIQYNAPTTLNFALVSFLVLILHLATRGVSTTKFFCVYRSPLTDLLTYPRFFTHVLGHSSFAHYSGNITLMLVLGPTLEERYGSRTILLAIVFTAFISGLLQWILFPGAALLGASGIVFAMILLSSITRTKDGAIPLTFVLVAALYIGQQVWQAVTAHGSVSYMAHIVGGAVGAALGFALNRISLKRQ